MTVRFFKYPDTPHWRHDAVMLGEDEHGVWFGTPAGGIAQRGDEPPHVFRRANVLCVPRAGWYAASYYAPLGDPGDDVAIYIDISGPADWRDDVPHIVDLDLDVIVRRDGTFFVDDEDEFELHRVERAYPADLERGARAALRSVVDAVRARAAPFTPETGEPWLAALAARGATPDSG